jgi:L-fucose mutarotase
MRRVPADEAANFPVPIYDDFQAALDAANKAAGGKEVKMELVERFAFYERAKKCFAVVQTGETRQYGNIIIKKGVIRVDE